MKEKKAKFYLVKAHYEKNQPPCNYLVPAYNIRQARIFFKKWFPWVTYIHSIEEYSKGKDEGVDKAYGHLWR